VVAAGLRTACFARTDSASCHTMHCCVACDYHNKYQLLA